MCLTPSERQAAFTGGVGQRIDAAVIQVTAAVEHDSLDAGGDRALGDQLADGRGRVLVGAGLQPVSASSSDEAAARVTPLRSSMTWA